MPSKKDPYEPTRIEWNVTRVLIAVQMPHLWLGKSNWMLKCCGGNWSSDLSAAILA